MTSRLSTPNTPADYQLRTLLDAKDPQSFVMVAGAGSGKTTSLVKALHHVATTQGPRLRVHAQQIACITYTEVAAWEIHTDVGNNPLVAVSTIHSFLWSVASPFQRDIQQWAIGRVDEKIAGLKERQASRIQQKTKDKNAADLEKLESQRNHLAEVKSFTYGVASDYSKGVLGHEDVVKLATDLIIGTGLLPRVIASKYPYIFVDESQDTFREVVMALKMIAAAHPDKVRVGFFGDPVQRIYLRGDGDIQHVPGWKRIEKPENFRSSNRVLDVINAVRSKTDDLIQKPGRGDAEQPEGETFFFVLPANDQQHGWLHQTTDWLNANSTAGDWRAEGTKILTITHRMAATRLGFKSLFDAFNDHKSDTLKQAFRDGGAWPLRPFEDVIFPLYKAKDAGSPAVIATLREHNGTAIAPDGASAELRLRLAEARKNVETLRQIVTTGGTGSVGAALKFALEAGFMEPDPRIATYLKLDGEQSDIVLPESTIRTLDAFTVCDVRELFPYFTYIRDSSPYSTQHGTKGTEFPRVIVVLDDDEARYNQYSFDKALGYKALSETDIGNQRSGKETIIDRTWRLLYVCVSRARESLAVVYFAEDTTRARQALVNSGITVGAPIMTAPDLT